MISYSEMFKLVCVSFLTVMMLEGCQKNGVPTYQGYAEGEFVNISSTQSGKLDKLFVKRGVQVGKDSALFALECDSELISLHQASYELSVAEATLNDYRKGARPQELSVIEAQLSQARANAQNAHAQLERNTPLYHANALSKSAFEDSAALEKSTASRVEELRDSLHVAKLAKRTDQITAQEARIKQLKAAVAQAQWKLDEKGLKARGNALVFDTLYREGEWVPAGGIVLRLLPPENIKIRFFVPQKIAEKLTVGQDVIVDSRADGRHLSARVTYISPEAEYTPPIIYSNETKDKLVFMIEAYPKTSDAPLLHPGQPVEVSLEHL